MNTSSKRQKGQDYERWIAKKYIEYDIDKNATRMPMSGADIYMKGDIRHCHPIEIPFKFIDECKRQENIDWYGWWKQTKNQCGQSEEPLLHFKKNNDESLTVLRTETFFSLLGTIIALSKEIKPDIETLNRQKTYNKSDAINRLKYLKTELGNIISKLDKNYDG